MYEQKKKVVYTNYISMKKIIITSIFATLCLPTLLFADATITTTEQCLVEWTGVNVDTCVITGTNGGGTLLGPGASYVAGGSDMIVGPFPSEASRVYTMRCKGNVGGVYAQMDNVSGTCTVDNPVTAPTTASVSITPASGLVNDNFTISIGASGGDAPTRYEYVFVTGPSCPSPASTPYNQTTTTFFPTNTAGGVGWTAGNTYRGCVRACNDGGCSPVVSDTYQVLHPTPSVNINFSLKQLKEMIRNIISERNQPNVFLNALLGYTNHSGASLAYQRSGQ